MSFTKYHISGKILCVIDIGSYKIRACGAIFKNKKIHIVGYCEKRQDSSYFANQECYNLIGLQENISDLIKKLESQIDFPLEEIVLNYPFGELFLGSKKINYKRKNIQKSIDISELEKIITSVEDICLRDLADKVEKLYGQSEEHIQILLSRVESITIDGEKKKKVIGKTGENMKISLLNVFIPASKHMLLTQIASALGKKLLHILPSEYCITKLFPHKDLVVINLGATQTTLSVVCNSHIIGVSKIAIGINDLVKKISQNSDLLRSQIIESIRSDNYIQEKKDFLSIWGECLGFALGESLGKNICPKSFYIGGGGGNNNFIQDYLKNFSFAHYDISTSGNLGFIDIDMNDALKGIEHITIENIPKIPLDMYGLLRETSHTLSKEGDILSNSLKKAIEILGYLKAES